MRFVVGVAAGVCCVAAVWWVSSGAIVSDERPLTVETSPASIPDTGHDATGSVEPNGDDSGTIAGSHGQADGEQKVNPFKPFPEPPEVAFRWEEVDDFERPLAVFETVFWDPRDSISLRQILRDTPLVAERSVLEIGTGSGLISLCCLQAGAKRVVATDINRMAVANAIYNAKSLKLTAGFEVNRVRRNDPSAYAVLKDSDRFDVIISNPPWEDQKPVTVDEFALYDEHFALLRSILAGLQRRLNPGGQALLAYGSVSAIRALHAMANELRLTVKQLDDRDLETLPENFLPGMLLEVSP